MRGRAKPKQAAFRLVTRTPCDWSAIRWSLVQRFRVECLLSAKPFNTKRAGLGQPQSAELSDFHRTAHARTSAPGLLAVAFVTVAGPGSARHGVALPGWKGTARNT
jgi:hypothetical protein